MPPKSASGIDQAALRALGRPKAVTAPMAIVPRGTILPAEVLPATAPSVADKMALVIVANEITDQTSLVAALAGSGFTYDQYVAASQTKEFMEAVQRHQHARDLPGLIKARTAVIGAGQGGNAYAFKTALDSTPDDPLSEDDAAYREQMSKADSKTLRREIMSQIQELLTALERVTGKRYTVVEASGESP